MRSRRPIVLAPRAEHCSDSMLVVAFESTSRAKASRMTDIRDRPELCSDNIRVRHRYQFGACMTMAGCHCGMQVVMYNTCAGVTMVPLLYACYNTSIEWLYCFLEVCVYHSGPSLVVSLASFGNIHGIVHESFRHITGTSCQCSGVVR